MTLTNDARATLIVSVVLGELRGRAGLDSAFDGIDADVTAEICDALKARVLNVLERP